MNGINKTAIVRTANHGKSVTVDEGIVEKYLINPLLWFSELATGVATLEKKEYILTGGQLIQGIIKGDLWNEFLYHLNETRKRGKSKRDFYQSRYGRINLNEIFSYINRSDTPEADVFKAMSAIFLNSINLTADEKEEVRAYHLLQTCKKLHSIDVLVLDAAYKLYLRHKAGETVGVWSESSWEETIAKMINLPVLLIRQSRNMHTGSGDSGLPLLFYVYNHTPNQDLPQLGLTNLGLDLAEYILKGKN